MTDHPDRLRVGAALLALLGVVGLYAFLQSPYFAIVDVRVEGAAVLDAASLIERAQVRAGDNVLYVDLQAVAGRLASHPRIQHAAVVRRLPGTVVIMITEYDPVAVAMGEEEAIGLAADGTRVPLVEGERERLPVLLDMPPQLVPAALQAAALVPADARPAMAVIGYDDQVGLWMESRPGDRILLGDGEELERKVAIAMELWTAGWRVIDVRLPRSPVVRARSQ